MHEIFIPKIIIEEILERSISESTVLPSIATEHCNSYVKVDCSNVSGSEMLSNNAWHVLQYIFIFVFVSRYQFTLFIIILKFTVQTQVRK